MHGNAQIIKITIKFVNPLCFSFLVSEITGTIRAIVIELSG